MLRAFPSLFENTNSVEVASARMRFVQRSVHGGERILGAGEAGRSVVGLMRGALEVRSEGAVVGMVEPGELFGEMALFEDLARTADVFALVDGDILEITREAYEELRDTAHPVAANLELLVLRQQASWLRQVDDRIARLSPGERPHSRSPGREFFAWIAAELGRGGALNPLPMDRVAIFRQSGLVADIHASVLDQLAGSFRVEACGAGEVLCTEGAAAGGLWLLASGSVDVIVQAGRQGNVQTVATLGAGALIGAAALVDGGVRMASCVVSAQTVMLTLDRATWQRLASDATLVGSAMRRAVIRALGSQLAGSNAMVRRFLAEPDGRDLAGARSRLVASISPLATRSADSPLTPDW